jgi:tRNA pseudouridine38-40 synthase
MSGANLWRENSRRSMAMNLKLTLEYDGTDFHGWQVQPDRATIQQALESALEKILGSSVRVQGAGRTDAGVHALGQVASCFCSKEVELRRLHKGLNALLRPQVTVKSVEAVDDGFDARRDARSRTYQYRIWARPWPSAFHGRYSWHVHAPLDLAAMECAAVYLEGEHDFSSFQAAGCDAANPVRLIYRSCFASEGEVLLYNIEATAFLRHMVRNIVGTLAQVGRGEISPGGFREILGLRDRSRAGPTAPAQGLFLVAVNY